MRRIVGVLIAIALGIGVFLLWPRSSDDPPANTEAMATSTTTTAAGPTSTTSTVQSTSTTGVESHVVETVDEAEEILRELWFGWFEGIYNQDEVQIREVVASEHQLELAVAQFNQMTFAAEPSRDDFEYSDSQILHSSDVCTVVFTTAVISGFTDALTTDVHVLRWDDGWRIFSLWAFPDDLWEDDCEAQL